MASSAAHTSQTNAQATVDALLRRLRVPVTSQTIRQTLQQHPDFPSLLSISDALDEWQVDNAAIQLGHVEQLRELPTPFVVHSTKEGGLYLLIETVSNGTITSLEPGSQHRQTEPEAQFAKHWSGVVLMAEKTEQSGEVDYQTKHRQEIIENLRWPSVLMGALLLTSVILLTVGESLTPIGWFWLLTKAMGLGLSLLLVQKQLGHANALTNKLCNVTGKTGCDEVLNAPAATLGGILPWSDVGLLYFSGGLLLSLLAGFQPVLWPILGLLALLALPYTVFSLYYQGIIARQWCTLCLGVQAVLLGEGVLAIVQGVSLPTTMQPYGWAVAAMLLPAISWLALKPTLQQATETEPLRRKLARFQNNPDLFAALLSNSHFALSYCFISK